MRVLLLLVVMIGGSMACQDRLETFLQEFVGGASDISTDVHEHCNAKVGTFNSAHAPEYKRVINMALRLAFEYMSISSHFGRDVEQRLGFQKLFRDGSDGRFEQAKEMIKYVTRRGGNMQNAINVQLPATRSYSPQPLPSLGLALDDAKAMHEKQAGLHRNALCLTAAAGGFPDPGCALDADLAHRSQDAIESEEGKIRDLAGKANLLTSMFTSHESALAEHLFDKYLQ